MEEGGVDLGFLERDYQAWELDSGQFPSKVGHTTLSPYCRILYRWEAGRRGWM